MPAFAFPAFLIFAALLSWGAHAQQSTVDVLASLGLVESETPVRDVPGWQKPKAVVVLIDDPSRIDWYRDVVPDDVELLPARNANEAAQQVRANANRVNASVGFCTPAVVNAGPNIHWLQITFSGIGGCASIPKVAQGDYLLTNMQRLAGPQIAEHVIAMMMYFARGLDHFAAAQANGKWDRFAVPPGSMWAVRNKTMMVAGLGGIGTQTARLASGLGMKVVATRNSRRDGPDFVDYVGLAHELPELAESADVVVNALPLTDGTRDLFDAPLFARMKNTALFINVGRGGSVVTEDLIAALENGEIAGAGLDVQDPEPVPPGHPLWSAPNLLITPHVSSFNDAGRETLWIIFRENLRRYVAGEKMLSVVDIQRGY